MESLEFSRGQHPGSSLARPPHSQPLTPSSFPFECSIGVNSCLLTLHFATSRSNLMGGVAQPVIGTQFLKSGLDQLFLDNPPHRRTSWRLVGRGALPIQDREGRVTHTHLRHLRPFPARRFPFVIRSGGAWRDSTSNKGWRFRMRRPD